MGKRKRSSQAGAGIDDAEAIRREKQRELRQLALKLRAQGKEYKQHKAKAKVYKDINQGTVVPRPSQQRTAVTEEKAGSRKPQADFKVAIIPIFWNQNPAQKKMVIAKCKAAQEILQAGSISSHVDDGSHFTPGQKMRHWEEKGVKVRLEVGPKDAEQSQCIIARRQPVPGQVAHKVPGEIGPTLPNAVQELLDMKDKDVPKGDWSKYEKKARVEGGDDARQEQGSRSAGTTSKQHQEVAKMASRRDGKRTDVGSEAEAAGYVDSDGGEEREDIGDATLSDHSHQAGDDLEDDFALEMEDVSVALTDADKKRMKKKDKKRSLLKGVASLGDHAPVPQSVPEKKKKEAKIVKFLG